MNCCCYICNDQESSPDHQGFIPSDFTLKSCTGNLIIIDYSVSSDQMYLGFRLNRHLSIHAKESTLVFPTWTIEDCLFTEVYQGTTLIGLGKILLAHCSFDGMQRISDFEWFTDISVEVVLNMSYETSEPRPPNCLAVYRETLGDEESDKLHIKVKIGEVENEHKIKDASLAFRPEIWQQIAVADLSENIEVKLTLDKKETSLILPKATKVVYTAVPTPLMEGNFLALYVIPFHSQFLVESSNTVYIQVQKTSNVWIESLPEGSVLNFALKSCLWSEGVNNEAPVSVQDFGECFEYQFVSYNIDDKILVKIFEQSKMSGVGILKLKEIAGIQTGKPFQTSVQIGLYSCQFWITLKTRARDQNEIAVEGHKSMQETGKNLTFKDPVFLDVLELLEFKINKMKTKNSIVTTQVNKVQTKSEFFKKKISELERAPNLSDYKKAETKKTTKTDTVKKDVEGLCGCGRPNPKFKGYCEECLKRVKADYERVFNWFAPIEKKHKDLEDKFININGRKILLELKIKRLEERVSRPIQIGEDEDIESAAEMAANLRKIEEEIQTLEIDTQNTANLYLRQEDQLKNDIKLAAVEEEKAKKDIEDIKGKISKNEENVAEAKDRLVFKQYFNEKYG